jgi:hypothetical protein
MENTVASRVQIFAGAQTIIAVREGMHNLFIFLCKIRLYFVNKLDLLLTKCRIRRFIIRLNVQNHCYLYLHVISSRVYELFNVLCNKALS